VPFDSMAAMTRSRHAAAALLLAAATTVAACGGSSSTSSSSTPGAGALSAEARSAATGDIPDNQNFLTFKGSGFSISYPEGWAQTGSGGDVSFRDKNNVVHVVVAPGSRPTAASVAAALARERARTPTLKAGTPQPVTLKGGPAIKVTYTTVSRPNPVTGKRVKLTVDRYVVASGGKVATVDLGTPVGVDNVDAYRMMAQSLRLR
jgi:hypothetical protein